jgi:hypothetical protein
MEPLTDLDLILPLFQKLTKKGREDFWREACLLYSEEIWKALKSQGAVDFSALEWSRKIPY